LHNATEVTDLLISVGFHSVRNTKRKGSSTYRWAGIFALKKGIYRIYSRNSVPLRYKNTGRHLHVDKTFLVNLPGPIDDFWQKGGGILNRETEKKYTIKGFDHTYF